MGEPPAGVPAAQIEGTFRRPGDGARGVGRAPAPTPTWRRALVWLWLGQVISHIGDSLFLVGIFYLALEITGSKASSGLLIAVNFLPALGLGLFAGAFVDRHDRRRVMLTADLLRAVAVAAIPILHAFGALTAWALAASMFSLALGSTLFNPAMKAIIPELVPPSFLTAAATLFQLSEFAALVVGPALAGLVILPVLGSQHLFSLDAATFLISALCVLALAPIARKTAHTPAPLRLGIGIPGGPGVWREVSEGLRAVLAIGTLRPLLLVIAFDNVLMMGLSQVATPVLVKEGLGLGNDAFARAQSFFFLGLLASGVAFWLLGRRAPKGPTILLGVVLDGLTFIPLAFCHTLGQVETALFIHGLAVPLIIIPRTVLVQQLVPGPLHGRAFSLLNVTVFGMSAISAAITGALSERVPISSLFLALGALGALPGLFGFFARSLRGTR